MKTIIVMILVFAGYLLGTVVERGNLFGRACVRHEGTNTGLFSCMIHGAVNKNSLMILSQFCDNPENQLLVVSSDEQRYTVYCD